MINKFLKGIGVSEEVIQKLTTAPTEGNDPANVDELISSYKTTQAEVLKNDPEIISNLRKQADGKARGSIEAKLKKVFALSEEDLSEIDRENNDALFYEEMAKVAHKKAAASKNKTVETLQKELQDANMEVKKLKEEEIPALKQHSQKEIQKFHINNKISELMPGEKDLIIAPKVAMKLINEHLWGDYDMQLDENSNLVVKTKDGLIPQNAEKTKNLTAKELIEMKLSEYGLKKESNAGGNAPPATPPPPGDNGEGYKYNLPGLDAAKKHAKDLNEKFGKQK